MNGIFNAAQSAMQSPAASALLGGAQDELNPNNRRKKLLAGLDTMGGMDANKVASSPAAAALLGGGFGKMAF